MPNTRMALGLAVALLVSVLVPSRTAGAADPVTIDAILSLTGYAAFIGQNQVIGIHALEEVTNRAGGIGGRPVHFNIVDDGSIPANAVQLANQIAARNAKVILGPSLTADCLAVLPRILDAGPVTLCLSPALYPKSGSFAFATGPSTFDQNAASLRYFRGRGWKRIAILATTDASGQDNERRTIEALALPENKSLSLVETEHFGVNDLSVTAQVERIRAAKPDAVIALIVGTPSGTALRGFHDAGFDPPIMLNSANLVERQIMGYGAFLPKTLLFPGPLSLAPEVTTDPAVRAEQQRFTEAMKAQGSPPLFTAGVLWDPARLIIEAMRRHGTNASAEQIRDYIAHVNGFAGVNGRMSYTDGNQRGVGASGCVILQWDDAAKRFADVSRPGGEPT
jgi:branched-chain amino acid transport system substrate-binding protein